MDKLLIIGLISIGGLMGTVIQLTRKYLVNKMDIYSIIVIDLFITGFFLLSASTVCAESPAPTAKTGQAAVEDESGGKGRASG